MGLEMGGRGWVGGGVSYQKSINATSGNSKSDTRCGSVAGLLMLATGTRTFRSPLVLVFILFRAGGGVKHTAKVGTPTVLCVVTEAQCPVLYSYAR